VRHTVVLALGTAALAAFGIGLALRPFGHHPARVSELDQVRAQLLAHYYRPLSTPELAKPSIAGLIGSLHDGYTAYLPPSAYRLARRAFQGGYGGIGVTVLPAPGGLLVRRTMNGPGRIAGLRPGDTIMTVDGASTATLSTEEAMGRIIGRPGSEVRLRVLRDGKAIEFRVVRTAYTLPSVHARLVGHVGVVRIDSFSRGTATATKSAVRTLTRQGATSFALDLRGNPGGLLGQAVSVVSLFLRPGASVVSLAGAHTPLRILYAKGGPASAVPLAVLVDGGSASASEVVAGALKDHGRATVVGESTYGKSLVQEIVTLPSGAALKLTVARYLTPAGVDISHNGVRPDIRSRHALDAALRLFTSRR
jgi:carboxyl-terminal processing protease